MNKEALLQAYFEHRLRPEQETAMKELLKTDAAFKAAYTEEYELREAIRQEERTALKGRFKALDRRGQSNKTRWLAAATLVAVLGIGALLIFNKPTDMQQLYAQHFEPYPNVVVPTVRNNETPEDQALADAFQLYDRGLYAEAAPAFQRLYEQTQDDDAFFYYVMSLMGIEQTATAVEALESHQWQQAAPYKVLSLWYRALGHLKLEQKQAAVSLLQQVADANELLSPRAERLLEQLDW